jgi:exopolyphosphatase/guanosine-5'-triphosphate,3'-diphosphate pyrophosphatase
MRDQISRCFSLSLGAVTLTEKYLTSDPVSKEQLAELLAVVKANLDNLPSGDKGTALVGVGGTITTMATVMVGLAKYDSEAVHGTILPFSEVERQMELYRSKTVEARKSIIGLQLERADIILAGVGIVHCLTKKFGADSALVSNHGIRHGLMMDRFGVGTAKAM